MLNEKIVVVYIEDDRPSRLLVERLLDRHGYAIYTADNGLDGINLVREKQPQLVLTDINLPDMSGREITTRVRGIENFASIPIVAITADASPGSREMALSVGCTGFLTKPIDVPTFPTQIKAFLDGRSESLNADEKNRNLEIHAQNLVKRLEDNIRDLETANRRLRELDRLKSDFIIMVSHELRTPLTLISGYTHLLNTQVSLSKKNDTVSSETLEGISTGLDSGVKRMQEVISEIIHVSHITSGTLDLSVGPLRIAQILRGVEKEYAPVCKERELTLTIGDTDNIPLIEADGARLRTAIENVVGNAVKYTPDGGHITITVKLIPNTDSIDIIIRDTGIGIPTEEQRNIFEQFYVLGEVAHHSTSKSAFGGGGLGIGLSITKGIIDAHHGRVWVESKGRDEKGLPGTAIHLVMPIKQKKRG